MNQPKNKFSKLIPFYETETAVIFAKEKSIEMSGETFFVVDLFGLLYVRNYRPFMRNNSFIKVVYSVKDGVIIKE